jgi:hypothetical protein
MFAYFKSANVYESDGSLHMLNLIGFVFISSCVIAKR